MKMEFAYLTIAATLAIGSAAELRAQTLGGSPTGRQTTSQKPPRGGFPTNGGEAGVRWEDFGGALPGVSDGVDREAIVAEVEIAAGARRARLEAIGERFVSQAGPGLTKEDVADALEAVSPEVGGRVLIDSLEPFLDSDSAIVAAPNQAMELLFDAAKLAVIEKDGFDLSITQQNGLNGYSEPSNRQRLLRRRNIPEDLEPYIRLGPTTIDGEPSFLVPRDWRNPGRADPSNPSDWIKSVGPEVDIVPAYDIEPFQFGSSVQTIDGVGETSDSKSKRRCGDLGAPPCYHPAVALLTNSGAVRCSGVLIADRWILTAAHCVCPTTLPGASAGSMTPSLQSLLMGGLTSKVNTHGRRTRAFGEVLRTDDGGFCRAYEELTKTEPGSAARRAAEQKVFARRDLALVRLREPLKLDGAEMIASILDPSRLEDVAAVKIVGLGISAGLPGGGRKTVFPSPVDHSACADIAPDIVCLPDREIALRSVIGKKPADGGAIANADTCGGDSGSGLFVRLVDGSLAVVAITSRGFDAGCGRGGIYARVADKVVIEWIQSVVEGDAKISDALHPDHQLKEEFAKWSFK
ncbi:MAG: trypsin-like serine protease [Pseudomonadota bacterium]